MPESRTWFLFQGRAESAKKSLERLYGRDNEIEARLAHMALSIRLEEQQALCYGAGSYADLLKGSNLKRIDGCVDVRRIWLRWCMSLGSSNLLSLIAGLEAIHSYDVAIGGFGIAIFAIVASWFLTGKRAIFLVSAAVNCIVMSVIGELYYSHNKGALWAVAIIMYVSTDSFRHTFNFADIAGIYSSHGKP